MIGDNNNSLEKRWKSFFEVAFAPGSIIFLLFTLGSLFVANTAFKNNLAMATVLSVMASMFAAIAGYFINQDLEKISGNSLLVKKGQSAIRNLDGIHQQIVKIRGWIDSFVPVKGITKKELIGELSEVDRHLETVQLNLRSGLLDWIDIVPELREREKEEKERTDVLKSYIDEVFKSKKELLKIDDDGQRKKLEKRIRELEAEMQKIKNQSIASINTGISGISFGAPMNFAGSLAASTMLKICSNCGKAYSQEPDSLMSLASLKSLCPDCRSKSFESTIK